MGEENFYSGSGGSYGYSSYYEKSLFGTEYGVPASSFAITTDARQANQLKEVSSKLNTGTKTIEISGLDTHDTHTLESIPKQHLEEINRLRKLAGNIDLTMHGPVIEAAGMSDREISESLRQRAERQMSLALDKAHALNPDGNVVVTFHSTAQLPELVGRVPEVVNGETKDKVTDLVVINERDGNMTIIKPKPNYLKEGKVESPYKELEEFNEEKWATQLSHATFQVQQAKKALSDVFNKKQVVNGKEVSKKDVIDAYKKYNTIEGRKELKAVDPELGAHLENAMNEINYGEIYARDSYGALQILFNQAWESAQQNKNEKDLDTLKRIGKDVEKARKNYLDEKDGKMHLEEFTESILNGVNTLNNLNKTPQLFKPMQEYVKEKSSETFSNAALDTYSKYGDKAPIISIENPPIGMGYGRAEDLKMLIDESRRKLAQKLMEKKDLSESEAKNQAEKLIGATWDVGHINMMKQFGYTDKDVVKETETIAKYVNKIHLSDNFGIEHTELPMGMGNVPMKEHLAKLKEKHGEEVGKIKKVIEAIDWYKNFQTSPFQKTLENFGSPIFGMQMSPYWNQAAQTQGPYFSGYGMMLPEQHFSIYGAGFSGMPMELGGQMSGRSRLSGNPME